MTAQLTKNQHIVPLKSISRFCDCNGRVWVRRRATEVSFQTKPSNKLFCARRAWEERSENGHKTIEDAYQEVAEEVCSSGLTALTQGQSDRVSAMFALWVARSRLAEAPLVGINAETMLGAAFPSDRNVSGRNSDERDQLEKAGFIVSDPDGSIPGRMLAWPHMKRQIATICAKLSGTRWGILQAETGEFLLPDRYHQLCLLPVSPKILLAAGRGAQTLSETDVANINGFAKADHGQWLISRMPF